MNTLDGKLISWDDLEDVEDNPYEWDALGKLKTHNPLSDANNLYTSMMLARKGTSWKASVQKFYWNNLSRLAALQRGLDALEKGDEGAYEPSDGAEFFANERGCIRPITGLTMDDRVVSHCVNDLDLMPKIIPYLVYDNSASLKGKGVSFARERMRVMLERYYAREHTDKGYLRLKDQTKYYDNIIHDYALDMIRGFTDNPLAVKIAERFLKHAELDVSDLTDEQFSLAQRVKFDRVKWRMGKHPKRGEKFLRKGVPVGDQFSQTIGVFYPYKVDNQAKIVRGSKYYQRYMDDSADLDRSLERLRERAAAIDHEADRIKLFTNTRKTVYVRTDKWFVWLKRKYRLKDGRVEMKILPKAVTGMKRRLRKMKKKVDAGKFSTEYVSGIAKSWLNARLDVMSYMQVRSIEKLVLNLYGRDAYEHIRDRTDRWKGTEWIDDEWRHVRQSGRGDQIGSQRSGAEKGDHH